MAHELRALFTPIQVGALTLENRIYSSGHAEAMADGGRPTERLRRYHEAKARGGCALTIFGGSSSVHPSSPAAAWKQIANHDDSVIPGYRAIADAVHAHGCRVFTQLTHLGRRAQSDPEAGHALLAPSQIPERVHREVPHELEAEQIAELVRAFGEAARRCRDGGLDGIEISMAHNHLIDQFWSPAFNQRLDEYGGSLDNRMRFGLEVLTEIRRRVGRDFVVGARISGDELTPGGLSASDMASIARRLAASGLVDFLSIIGGGAHTSWLQAAAVPNMSFGAGLYVPLAAQVKAAAPGVAILHASRIVDPVHADRLVAAGEIDVVGMTRALIADPELPRKAREGRLGDIRRCVGANEGCIDRIYQGKAVTCVQNPATGRERELGDVRPAATAKRVVVVGGGVAGLEAARVAALRGCRVVLMEKAAELGGQILLAARAPARAEYAGIVRFLASQVEKLGVDVRLGMEATPALVLGEHPDAVVVATGSHPHIPPVPGSDGKHVVTDRDVPGGEATAGRNVVLATGSRSTDALYRALKGQVGALYAAGDCVAPRGVHQAILDGTRVARAI